MKYARKTPPLVSAIPRAIQALILFSTVLGVFFLMQAYPVLPSFVFYFISFGWVLFVVASVLTFVRPRGSFYLALVLAVAALAATLSQPEHYALVESGNVPATITLFLGSAAEILIVVLTLYYFLAGQKGDPWSLGGKRANATVG